MQSKIQEYRDIYKAYKKDYNVILKTARANYIQNIITRLNKTPKVLWEDYHKYVHYSSKPSVAGCIFYNKLPNNIKQIENKNQFTRELKKLLIKGCYYSIEDYLNEEFSNIGY
jgi:hypothetical protein